MVLENNHLALLKKFPKMIIKAATEGLPASNKALLTQELLNWTVIQYIRCKTLSEWHRTYHKTDYVNTKRNDLIFKELYIINKILMP